MLTPKQKIILNTLRGYFAHNGKMPSIRVLKEEASKYGLHVKSTRSIFLYLNSLEELGYIKRSQSQGIEFISGTDKQLVNVPVFGSANAGNPTLLAEQNIEGYLKLSRNFVRSDKIFAIKVHGDSMSNAEIHGKPIMDGHYIIVDPETEIRDLDKVLVAIDGVATVKEYRNVEHGIIGLFPVSSNKIHQPIYLTEDDNFIINGKVIGVLKS